MTYKLTASTSITRIADGATIPADPGNTDYAAYLAWVAEGNMPEPADQLPGPDPQALIDALEQANLLPRVTREFMLIQFAAVAAQQGVDPMTNVAYRKVKELDDRITELRSQL